MCDKVDTKELKKIALLHDATEAYMRDLPKPLKYLLPDYQKMEDTLWKVISTRFNVPFELPDVIKEIDMRLLMTERECQLVHHIRWDLDVLNIERYPEDIVAWEEEKSIRARYTSRLYALQDESIWRTYGLL